MKALRLALARQLGYSEEARGLELGSYANLSKQVHYPFSLGSRKKNIGTHLPETGTSATASRLQLTPLLSHTAPSPRRAPLKERSETTSGLHVDIHSTARRGGTAISDAKCSQAPLEANSRRAGLNLQRRRRSRPPRGPKKAPKKMVSIPYPKPSLPLLGRFSAAPRLLLGASLALGVLERERARLRLGSLSARLGVPPRRAHASSCSHRVAPRSLSTTSTLS